MFDGPVLAYKLVCGGNQSLTNALVKTRKAHPCCICAETIGAGDRVRRETRRSDDGKRIETRHVCQHCADAIAEDVATGEYSTEAVASGDYWARINARHALAKARAA